MMTQTPATGVSPKSLALIKSPAAQTARLRKGISRDNQLSILSIKFRNMIKFSFSTR